MEKTCLWFVGQVPQGEVVKEQSLVEDVVPVALVRNSNRVEYIAPAGDKVELPSVGKVWIEEVGSSVNPKISGRR